MAGVLGHSESENGRLGTSRSRASTNGQMQASHLKMGDYTPGRAAEELADELRYSSRVVAIVGDLTILRSPSPGPDARRMSELVKEREEKRKLLFLMRHSQDSDSSYAASMPATTRSAASGRAKSPRPLLSARVSSPRRSYRSRSPNASQHSQRGDSAPSGGAASAAMTPFAGLLSTISGALGAVTDAAGGADGLAETQHWLMSGGGSRGSSSAQPASTANGRHAQNPPVRVEPGLGLVYTPRKYRPDPYSYQGENGYERPDYLRDLGGDEPIGTRPEPLARPAPAQPPAAARTRHARRRARARQSHLPRERRAASGLELTLQRRPRPNPALRARSASTCTSACPISTG